MMSSRVLKEEKEGEESRFARFVHRTLDKMTNGYTNMLSAVMAVRGFVLLFAVLIFASLPFLFTSLSNEVAPTEDRGFVVGISNGPSNTNLDYTEEALAPFNEKVSNIPEVSSVMTISGIGGGSGALSIIALKDWNERTRGRAEISNEIAALGKKVVAMDVNAIAFPEISTGENGLPFSLVITSADSYEKLAIVASEFLKKAQASGQFFFAT